MSAGRPKLVLLGGDGARSGVPRYLGQVARVLEDEAEIVIVAEEDRGGFSFVHEMGLRHRVVEGLASSLRPGRLTRGASRLGEVLAEEAPTVVWANARVTLPMARLCLSRAMWRQGTRPALIATYHGIPFGAGRRRAFSALQWGVEWLSLRMAPGEWQVFLTEEDRARLQPLAGGRHRGRVISNGSDLGGFVPREPGGAGREGLRLVMLTRDAPQKNLDAAARLMAALPGTVTLSLYGTGTDDPGLKRRFAAVLGEAGLARVRFGGPAANVRPALAGADMLLVTSRYEGQSLAMLEAMEYGLPIVSTRVGGAAALARVHPMMALVDLADAEAVREAAGRVVALGQAWKADSAGASRRIHAAWARDFSHESFRREVRALWEAVLAEGRNRPVR